MPGVYDVQTTFFTGAAASSPTARPWTPTGAPGCPQPRSTPSERLMDWSARSVGSSRWRSAARASSPASLFPYRIGGGRALRRGRLRAGARPGARPMGRRVPGAEGGRARPKAGSGGSGSPTTSNLILGSQDETTTIAFADDGMVELLRGHAVEWAGARDGVRPDPRRASGVPFERDPLRAGRQRPDRQGWRNRRVAVDDHAGELDPPRRGRGDRAVPAAGGGELEVAGADLVFEEGAFRVAGTDREVGLVPTSPRRPGRRGKTEPLKHHARVHRTGPVLSERGAFRRGGGGPGDGADTGW